MKPQARIQEFSSEGGGGSNYPNIFDKQKKKKKREREREKTEGLVCSFPSAEVWFKSTSKFIFGREWFFCTIESFCTQTPGCHGSFDIVNVSWMGGGGLGVLPQNIFGL